MPSKKNPDGRNSDMERPSKSRPAKDRQADGDERPPQQGNDAGQEAARGIHGDRHTDDPRERGTDELPGSEPLKNRSQEHVSGYGGEKGNPKRSSDQR